MYGIKFQISTPLISVNDAYMDRPKKSKSGKWTAYRTAAPGLREYQERVTKLVQDSIGEENLEFIKALTRSKENGILLDIEVGIPEDIFNRSDASNFIKPYEDVLSKVIELDDKYNLRVSIEKYPADNWIIKTNIHFVSILDWRIVHEETSHSSIS